ncbi:hypothetical protein [Acetobacter tropicalis]|nr:hypothetical protein [Acetobacter tropicalis]
MMAGLPRLERLTDDQRASVIAEYLAGTSCEDLAKKYGYSAPQLARYVRLKAPAGQYRGANRSAVTDEQAKQAIAMLKQGLKRKEIAYNLDISVGVLYRAIKRHEAESVMQAGRPRHETIALVADGIRRGLSHRDIARQLGIAQSTVKKNYYKAALALLSDTQKPVLPAPKPKPTVTARLKLSSEPLPFGHAIPVNAMWRGLERWRSAGA